MSLESLAADLRRVGIGFSIVTAATSAASAASTDILPLSKWKHTKPKAYPSVDYYTLAGKSVTYEIIKVDTGDDDSEEVVRWVLVKKQPKANAAKTAVVPSALVYIGNAWKEYPHYRSVAKFFDTPEDAYRQLVKLSKRQ